MKMSKGPLLSAIIVAMLAASSAPAQILGGRGGSLGGLGGMGGATGGAIGSTVGQAGRTVGGAVGPVGSGPISGIDRTIGTLGDSINSVTSQVNPAGVLPDTVAQMWPVDLDRVYEQGIWLEPPERIANIRKARLDLLVKMNRNVLDVDGSGQPVRKAELIVTNPDTAGLSRAIRAGFRLLGDETERDLGLRVVTLAVPRTINWVRWR